MIKLAENKEDQSQKISEQLVNLPVGLSAVALPDFEPETTHQNGAELTPKSPEIVLNDLNEFLGNLNEKGLDIVTVLEIPVQKKVKYGINEGSKRGGIKYFNTTQYFAIIRKAGGDV